MTRTAEHYEAMRDRHLETAYREMLSHSFPASIDGWKLTAKRCRRNPETFTLTTWSSVAAKDTWAWLTGPTTIRKPVADFELNRVYEITLECEIGSATFRGWIETKEFRCDHYGVCTTEFRGFVAKSQS